MRRWATAQKTKLNSACNAATQVDAAQPLLDLACGKMGSFFPPLGWVKHLLPLDPACYVIAINDNSMATNVHAFLSGIEFIHNQARQLSPNCTTML